LRLLIHKHPAAIEILDQGNLRASGARCESQSAQDDCCRNGRTFTHHLFDAGRRGLYSPCNRRLGEGDNEFE